MSLKSFLNDKEVKMLFSNSFTIPSNKLSGHIRAPVLTTKYPLIGTAFDYLMRFHLKYYNPYAIMDKWVAKNACELMKRYESDEFYAEASGKLDFAVESYHEFMANGVLTDELIKSSILLAHLDIYYRAGKEEYTKPIEIESSDIQDLKNLIGVVDFSQFETKSHCLLNPSFNEASKLVAGADADIVIDNKLIDIKTTQKLVVTRDMFNQVIGYYLLGLMGGLGEQKIKGSTIDKIGFYFSRYGILHFYDVKDIIDFEMIPDFMEKMKNLAEKSLCKKEKSRLNRL